VHPAFERTDHRPWPVPTRPWRWRQSWRDLLFAHFTVPRQQLAHLVPSTLTLDEYGGECWIGVVPFRMSGVMRRHLPDLPWLSAFPELNVRTYVRFRERRGVWFLSLDATNPLAVWAARRFFHLPYHRARMRLRRQGQAVEYASARPGARFRARYAPTSKAYSAIPGSLEYWLTERYCLFAQAPDGTILINEVHHLPWPLQQAEAKVTENTMLESHGISVGKAPPVLHFARRLDVVVWDAEPIRP
jgi:uncharacterized protein